MADETSDLRSAQARIAALTRAARTDGREISAPARKAFLDSFLEGHSCNLCKPVTINPALPPDQRARAAEALMRAHFTRLALKSALARGRIARGRDEASDADRELAEGLAQLDAG
jgi:hypothetical protein